MNTTANDALNSTDEDYCKPQWDWNFTIAPAGTGVFGYTGLCTSVKNFLSFVGVPLPLRNAHHPSLLPHAQLVSSKLWSWAAAT
uniref:Uncharacterized protein n=1 Tax=Pristionchus pacificus TaxID=54126 RepID=A0A2A6CND4_PRIPA|eukprot:PDM79712.1 hypothetical protein PRIPAC_32291 [Pristionchus pacificus]